MAKDSAHSRIPRLDGITRIPLPGPIRIPQKSQISAAGKLARPTSYSGLRPPLSSAVSLKKSFSGERISEAASMVGKKAATVVKKFLINPDKSSSMDDHQKHGLSALETDMTYNVCKNLTTSHHESTDDSTRSITRSQTFIRDSTEDDVQNNLLGITHDIFPSSPMKRTHCASNSGFGTHVLLDVTQNFDNTVGYDSNTKMKEDIFVDTLSCERLSDISIPSYDADATLKPLSTCESNSHSNMVNLTNNFEDAMALVPDRGDLRLALNSTMNNDRLLDVTETISPSRHLMNITRDIMSSPQSQHNNTNLLYISRPDLEGTVLVPQKSAQDEKMDVDEPSKFEAFEIPSSVAHAFSSSTLQGKPRFSFGLDLTECTLDCSIELCDVSLSSSAPAQVTSPSLKKQNSFEMDESLGILTPDQMKEFLDSATTTTNLDLPINVHPGTKLLLHQLRIDQTPSPEDLPLDPIGVKTDVGDLIMSAQPPVLQQVATCTEHSQTDSDSKTDQMTKSSVSKVSTSFITSVTSITSLDTGYQGDGEMSRPASRGAGDHSPSNVPRKAHLGRQPSFSQNNSQNIPIRRQDPMTDSDFFTESDADDIFHRGDRRAQVIDGQLYGPMLQPSNVFITEQPQMEDSCMESSGIFTDVENRCDDDIVQNRREADIDMSPDGSTDTVKSNNNGSGNEPLRSISPMSQGHSNVLTDSQTSSTIQSSLSCERISVSSVSGESLQSRRNVGTDQLTSKSPSVSGSIGALNSKPPANNDAKKAVVAQKSELTTPQPSLVKKASPARKHHAYGGGKYETKTNAIVENTAKTGISTGCDLTAEKPAVLSAKTAKKSASAVTLNEACDGDMFIKGGVKRSENQENKRPGLGALAVRKPPLNKWDAVMSKIAESKTHKKNYSEVKSKISTGVLRRSAPGVSKSPTGQSQDSNCTSVNSTSGLNSPQTKRALQGPAKRGRSYSKDSQLSSQSDLSLSGGSPKLQSKISPGARAAKKRDVRTLSISPTDLGPPSKTQTNITSRTKQQPALAQKRTSHTQQTLSSPLANLKVSSPVKKVTTRRSQLQQSVSKVPLKDHNRLSSQSQQQQQSGSQKAGLNISTKSASISPVSSCSPLQGGIKTGSRNYIENTRTSACSNGIGQPLFLQKQTIPEQTSNQSILDFRLSHVSKGVEALGVLLQYLVYDLEAFSCPLIKKECNKAQKDLLETNLRLEGARAKCDELKDEIQDKEAYYIARETELQTLHRCELQRVQSSLSELEVSAKERITALEAELVSKDEAHYRKLQEYICDYQAKLMAKEREIELAKDREQELLNRLSSLSTAENALREKVLLSENSFAERLQAASQRERELTEKINGLNKQLDALRHETESKERELEEKLHLSHDEISVLRSSRNSLDQAPSPKNGAASKVQMLQDEVESLRCVLELKQSEISDLRKHNQELMRAADELPAAQMKISALESRIEDLQIQLKAKIEEEKELIQKNKHLQESYSHEVKNRNRLSLHNEELQWRLKQNSEKFALALTEISKSYQENAGYLSVSKGSFHSQENTDFSHNSSLTSLNRSVNGSDRMVGCFQMDDVSPPTSPIIKGVVEKSDSVSWVLEMDDESPEVLASRMVRRAGSFRSSFNEKSPGARRQSSLPTSSSGGNPLSQSASATSVIQQHSNESVDCPNIVSTQPNCRTRSKSVTIKGSENPKKLVRQSSSGNGSTSRKVELSSLWKEPICSSSPYSRRSGSRMSPKGVGTQSPPATSPRASFSAESESVVYRKPQRNLITCDTSALTSADRLRTIPTSHPSVQDFKSLKKCQEIQESAGEAMVSGTNSEDEGCSASSDETVSSASSSTSSLGGKQHLSIEDALLIEKISTSLGGTPMEVSWSDDGDQFPSESVV